MPSGIGALEPKVTEAVQTTNTRLGFSRTNVEWLIVDPMTREMIGKVPVLDEFGKPVIYRGVPKFEVHDHWFVLSMKFEWGPDGFTEETTESQSAGGVGPGGYGPGGGPVY
jgi:hypothetical protein